MIKTLHFSALLFICLIAGTVVKAQTADDIVKKYFEAVGGYDNWKKINTMKMAGSMKANGADIQSTITKVNNKAMKADWSMNGSTGYTIFTNKEGWSYNPFGGTGKAEAMTPEMVKAGQEDLCIAGPLMDYASKGNKIEYLGKDDVEGTECHKLKLTTTAGAIYTMYFDATNFYKIRDVAKVNVNGKEVENTTTYSNFKKLPEGIVFPMTLGTAYGEVTLSNIEINKPVDDKIFKPNN